MCQGHLKITFGCCTIIKFTNISRLNGLVYLTDYEPNEQSTISALTTKCRDSVGNLAMKNE